ncbi:acyl-homoserine-lactone synthase [Bradyrhizobium sp. RDI18]|uniref:acyl-homoserine-lactone synthase n=1 Tax=Bradyrhizobium sp. RDI18 TaxID=3367400 RepID=UPI00371B98F2
MLLEQRRHIEKMCSEQAELCRLSNSFEGGMGWRCVTAGVSRPLSPGPGHGMLAGTAADDPGLINKDVHPGFPEYRATAPNDLMPAAGTEPSMIEAFSIATAHLHQDALASQARLRHEVFVRRRGLPHSSYEGLEFDEFDAPAAKYLVWRDEDRVVRGLARLLPTTRPYMLSSYWSHLVEDGNLPASPSSRSPGSA